MEAQNESYTLKNRKNTYRLMFWTAGWVASLAVLMFGARYLWDYQPVLSILVLLTNVLIGIGMIIANIKYVSALDDMQRKINLDAMGIALGVGLIGGIAYSTMEKIQLINFQAEIPHLVILMSIAYLITLVTGHLRYK